MATLFSFQRGNSCDSLITNKNVFTMIKKGESLKPDGTQNVLQHLGELHLDSNNELDRPFLSNTVAVYMMKK